MAISPSAASKLHYGADLLDDRRLDAFGRLVEDEQARARDKRAADGELLLLAAGKVAAASSEHLAEHGKQLEDTVGHEPIRARQHAERRPEVFADGEQGEDLAALRNQGDSPPAPSGPDRRPADPCPPTRCVRH